MRIAFIVNNYPPRTGGVELHVRALAAELVRRGNDVTVVTLGPATGWREDAGIAVLTLGERFRVADILGFPRLGTRRRLTRLLRERDIDIVSTHTRFFPMSYVGMRAAQAARVPSVHTEHGSDHVVSNSAVIRFASRIVDHTLGRAVLRGADQVLGVSENVVQFVRRLAGVSAGLFYNAIEPRLSGRRAVVADDRPSHLVFVGRLVPGKGWEDYLDAVAGLRAEQIPVTGEVLGGGVDLERVRAQVADCGLGELVTVRGRVAQSRVGDALHGATLVNPTRLSEGFQTTLLEAIAEGGRVVTYPVPGARTLQQSGAPVCIVAETTSGALVAALKQLIHQPPETAPRSFIDDWTWPARAEQYVGICTDLIGERHTR